MFFSVLINLPAARVSSKEGVPRVPAQAMVKWLLIPAIRSAITPILAKEVTQTFFAFFTLFSVLLPLEVAKIIPLLKIPSLVYSRGELPRSKPSIFNDFLSPPNK
jgi:hypothetical protein